MTLEQIRQFAQVAAKMANAFALMTRRYQWRPISELHEDYGPCVLMNIEDPGSLEVGSNLDTDYDASRWTHFSRIAILGQEEYERLMDACHAAAIPQAETPEPMSPDSNNSTEEPTR